VHTDVQSRGEAALVMFAMLGVLFWLCVVMLCFRIVQVPERCGSC
jgi:hypothetical protein